VTVVRFLSGPVRLVVAMSNFGFYVFDIQTRSLSQWSQDVGFPITLPYELKHQTDFPVRIAPHPVDANKFLVGSFGCFCIVTTDKGIPSHCQTFPATHVRRRKRKHSASWGNAQNQGEDEMNCKLCLRYDGMLFMDFVSNEEMVVVEQPWLNVIATFPDALERKVYGN